MLRELKKVSQRKDEARRRWFADPYFDLIVWYEPDPPEQILGFQLCYDKNHNEHALTWKRQSGISHHAVDDGQETPRSNRTPILVPDGAIPVDDLRQRFEAACGDLDPDIARLVLARLEDLAGPGSADA